MPAVTVNRNIPHARSLTVVWLLLLLLGILFLFAAVSDLAADARTGIPADHTSTFQALTGTSWEAATQTSPGLTSYITLLEVAYAVHELVFALLFLAIIAIPLRQGARWAWWACWVPMLATVTYALTFGRHDATLLARSLVAAVGLPILLLAYLPRVLGRAQVRGR
jgi:hypothetical protein